MPVTRRHVQRRSVMKAERFNARLSPEQKALFQKAATLQHQPLSQFVISSAQRAAEEVLRDYERTQLSAQDWDAVMQALADPGPVNPNLARAAQRYKAFRGER